MTATRALINPKLATQITQLVGMFSSHHDGEVINAARIADRLLRDCGLTWADIIVQPVGEWQALVKACGRRWPELTTKERDFLTNVARLRKPPSDAQLRWLEDIYARLSAEHAA
jgi:hypothetical protein